MAKQAKPSRELAIALGVISAKLAGRNALIGGMMRLRLEYPDIRLVQCKRMVKEYLKDKGEEA